MTLDNDRCSVVRLRALCLVVASHPGSKDNESVASQDMPLKEFDLCGDVTMVRVRRLQKRFSPFPQMFHIPDAVLECSLYCMFSGTCTDSNKSDGKQRTNDVCEQRFCEHFLVLQERWRTTFAIRERDFPTQWKVKSFDRTVGEDKRRLRAARLRALSRSARTMEDDNREHDFPTQWKVKSFDTTVSEDKRRLRAELLRALSRSARTIEAGL
jgi:hypothetical protein